LAPSLGGIRAVHLIPDPSRLLLCRLLLSLIGEMVVRPRLTPWRVIDASTKICARIVLFVLGWVTDLSTDRARVASAGARHRHLDRILRGTVCAVALATALAAMSLVATSLPAVAARDGPKDKHKPKHKETAHVSKDPFDSMPKGPLQIIISINQQRLHLYSGGAHVTDALIASGMPGHATPMGVFSVIEKDRYHRSNIYSSAPMPFMQRITWSGVAMHEGVGLGHPASHGCIRMPHEFAARLFLLRSLGARVIIARPELKLAEIADPHLFVHKTPAPPPAPSAAAPAPMEPIKTAQSIDNSKTTDAVVSDAPAGPVEGTRTFVSVKDPAASAAATADNADGRASRQPDAEKAAETRTVEPAAENSAASSPNDHAADAPAAAAEQQPTESAAASKPAKIDSLSTPSPDAASQAPTAAASVEATATAAKPDPKIDSETDAKPDTAPSVGETSKPVTPAVDVASPTPADTTPSTVPVPAPKPPAIAKPLKHDPIAIFVSRRTKKIYVRQDFAPLFGAAVTIERPDEPLGTHVFTAMGYLDNGTTFRWNVVSLPGEEPKPARATEKKSEKDGKGKKHEAAKPNPDPQPPQTPQQALARIEIPQTVIDQISELMTPGSSLVISDQGLGEETGEGTDFIVVTR
jgi:hypothetical protein